jgi:hypothetical protein
LDLLRVQDPLEQGCDEGVAEAVEGEPLVGEPGLCQQRLVPPLVEVVVVVGLPTQLGKTRPWSRHQGDRSLASLEALPCAAGVASEAASGGQVAKRGDALP